MSRHRRGGPPRREPEARSQRRQLLVFVEGDRTEDEYLTHWHRRYRDHVIVRIDPFHGDPMALVERAIETHRSDARAERRKRGRAYDEYWCVFDRDEHPRFEEARRRARESGIGVAFSNPCIELWFLLHFTDQTAYIDRHDAQHRSREHLACQGKALNEAALEALVERYTDAMKRARALDDWHAGNGSPSGENPSSSMWTLIEVIRQSRETG